LALAMGACCSAFRLMDALLWRPLPVSHPERLYGLSRQGIGFDGKWGSFDSWAHPAYVQMREAVKNDADLIAVSYADRADVTYTTDQEMEKATVVQVSGNMFSVFGLNPGAGRLLTDADDAAPGKAPYAVISDDYWNRRFQRDPNVVGKTLHYQGGVYEIVGVAQRGFTGTAPGTVVDVFLPTAMHRGFNRLDWTWFRTLVALHEGVEAKPVRDRLAAVSQRFEEKRLSSSKGLSAETRKNVLNNEFVMSWAPTGVSGFQEEYRSALTALGVLVLMVLLIACANVANLMVAQAAGRAKEMALRVSIGAGRWRLVQMVLVESALMALLAAAGGSALCLVVGADGDADDRPAGCAGSAVAAGGCAGDSVWRGPDVWGHAAVWYAACVAGFVGKTGECAEGRRGAAVATHDDARDDWDAGDVLLCGVVCGGTVCCDVQEAIDTADGFFE
ncbi:MAG TPA: ABC transporter permease, partial [Tepidisphaeraceae bacterium]|nr:ABC transporter permease [Tepidisphaeraceae bacterium]